MSFDIADCLLLFNAIRLETIRSAPQLCSDDMLNVCTGYDKTRLGAHTDERWNNLAVSVESMISGGISILPVAN